MGSQSQIPLHESSPVGLQTYIEIGVDGPDALWKIFWQRASHRISVTFDRQEHIARIGSVHCSQQPLHLYKTWVDIQSNGTRQREEPRTWT